MPNYRRCGHESAFGSPRRLPPLWFDKIKIDQSFISNLKSNPQSAAIVCAVVGLARGLNLPVLAEGVETSAQLEFLAAESCDEAQGYLIGRPQPIAEYAELTGAADPAEAASRSA